MSRNSVVTAEQRVEARELYASGVGQSEIARRLGITKEQARWSVVKRNRSAESTKPRVSEDGMSFRPRAPRMLRRILAPSESVIGAARAFAAGEISRDELMMRITP